MGTGQVSTRLGSARGTAGNHRWFGHAVRVGILAYGLVHLVIGWIALQLAFGNREGQASTDGALSQLAQTPVGGFSMWVATFGFTALVLWQLTDAVWGHREQEGARLVLARLGSGLKAALYGALAVSALRIGTGSSGGSGGTDSMTARLMSMPAGQLLVALVGLGVLGYALWEIYQGLSESFMDKLDIRGRTGDTQKAFVTFGKVGYTAKGVALMLVGGLFLWAAATHDPAKSGGLDQALQKVLEQPFGVPALVALATGIACYGLFAFAWARHLDR